MSFAEATAMLIECDCCPRCQHYIDKQFICKDDKTELSIGVVKSCKFHTSESWVCYFKQKESKAVNTDRDCDNCIHHTDNGCTVWDCEYEPKEKK